MRTCIDNRKRKVFNDIKHLSTKAVLLIIFLSLLPALQVMAMETPDETQQKSTIRVQGRVLDEFNQPLPGVSILAVKSTKGVITDIDGNYSIEVAPDEKLEFSYIGYQKNVVLVNGRKDIPIKMEPLTSELKEVTVVGYGTQRKASVIGAITGLPVGKINRSVNKLSNVLAGQMAGVVAVQRSGEPGEGSDFWIRGVSTFGANNRPLVLVDGIERDLNLVDPEDIETFSILKDATATAIYGVRGANGVVLITTRKGKEGSKPVISARAEFSILQPTKMPKMANAQEFMEMYNFAYADNKNGEEFYSPEAMAKYLNGSDPDLYPNINWMDEIYKNSTTSERVNINVTGGSGGDFEKSLEQIITQKWIANFPNGMESWTEYRRTGYPKLMPMAANASGGIVNDAEGARRMPYPTDEYRENRESVEAAVATLTQESKTKRGDTMATHVWWDCK